MPQHGTTRYAKHARPSSDERVRAPARVDHEGRRYKGGRVYGGPGNYLRGSLPCRFAAPRQEK
jgi:acyl-coenzyme A thioesterase PaaI-like protein